MASEKAGSPGGIDESTRHELAVLAKRPHARTSAFTRERPSDWRPGQVRNPNGILDDHFTESTAWELIAERLETGEHVELIDLRQPRGARGYVMRIDLGSELPKLYVKLQLGSGGIFGRSFHYSERD